MEKVRVTVYIPCRDYGRFLDQAVASVAGQSYPQWELIVIDDGSTDETASVAARWAAAEPRIRVLRHERARGLPACANVALGMVRGEYLMRLDADDYLDESALLVLVNYLDRHPDVALVYPNYVCVDERGRIIGVERRKRVGTEALVLDLPAHGACTMIRKEILKRVNGYSEAQDRQDGYDLWLKIARDYPVANLETPLFFYRQHGTSLSRDEERLLHARRQIKRTAASNGTSDGTLGFCVAIVPAKNTYEHLPDVVLAPLAGKPMIDYTLKAALEIDAFQIILVSTDDPRVAEYASRFSPRVLSYIRPESLSDQHASDETVLKHGMHYLQREHGIFPDTLVSLSVNCPLRRSHHIREALDTFLLFRTDMVLSVYEDLGLHFVHGAAGLQTLNPAMHLQIRLEREALYVWNGAVRVLRSQVLGNNNLTACTVGHIVMRYEESFQIKTEFERWLVEKVLIAQDMAKDHETTPAGGMENRKHGNRG